MRVLVTGGAGFVGSHIVDRLVNRGDEVLVVDDLSTGKQANLTREAKLEEMDIADPSLLKLAASFRPDTITHCAARASVSASMAEPALDAATNILGGINVCKAAITAQCHQFIYITTGGALYGSPEYLPCDEEHRIRPESGYGLSKWTLEQYLRLLLPSSVQLKVLRLANVYGSRQDPYGEAGVVAIFAMRMLRGEQVDVFGDGEQTRDFVYAVDVARAHERAQLSRGPVTVNIGVEAATTINELYRLISTETGYTLPPSYAPERPGDVKYIVLANSRAKRELGWEPKTQLREGLSETVAWFRQKL